MVLKRDTIFKAVLLIGLASFLSFGTLGLGHGGMGMESTASSNCPFMPGMTSVCKMNPLEHIAAWQSAFTAIPLGKTLVLSLLLLLALLLIRTFLGKLSWDLKILSYFVQLLSRGRNPFVPRYVLQEAFSNGIIHSKVF